MKPDLTEGARIHATFCTLQQYRDMRKNTGCVILLSTSSKDLHCVHREQYHSTAQYTFAQIGTLHMTDLTASLYTYES